MWVQGTSLAWAGHDPATAKHRGQRETTSTRSRSTLETSTPIDPSSAFRQHAVYMTARPRTASCRRPRCATRGRVGRSGLLPAADDVRCSDHDAGAEHLAADHDPSAGPARRRPRHADRGTGGSPAGGGAGQGPVAQQRLIGVGQDHPLSIAYVLDLLPERLALLDPSAHTASREADAAGRDPWAGHAHGAASARSSPQRPAAAGGGRSPSRPRARPAAAKSSWSWRRPPGLR